VALSRLSLRSAPAQLQRTDSSAREPGGMAGAGQSAPARSPFTHEIVLLAQQLPHRHPAERFLAATAQMMDLTLVTADDRLLSLGTIGTMNN
jgi:hypothetical protein